MTLPVFPPGADPGASFGALLQRSGLAPVQITEPPPPGGASLTHATTIVAMRYADGVVMAGDRRATAGNVIAHRSMDKVFPADRFSGVSISGVAGTVVGVIAGLQSEISAEAVAGIVAIIAASTLALLKVLQDE